MPFVHLSLQIDKQSKQILEKDQPTRAQPTYDSLNEIDPMASIFQARKLTPYFESVMVGTLLALVRVVP